MVSLKIKKQFDSSELVWPDTARRIQNKNKNMPITGHFYVQYSSIVIIIYVYVIKISSIVKTKQEIQTCCQLLEDSLLFIWWSKRLF